MRSSVDPTAKTLLKLAAAAKGGVLLLETVPGGLDEGDVLAHPLDAALGVLLAPLGLVVDGLDVLVQLAPVAGLALPLGQLGLELAGLALELGVLLAQLGRVLARLVVRRVVRRPPQLAVLPLQLRVLAPQLVRPRPRRLEVPQLDGEVLVLPQQLLVGLPPDDPLAALHVGVVVDAVDPVRAEASPPVLAVAPGAPRLDLVFEIDTAGAASHVEMYQVLVSAGVDGSVGRAGDGLDAVSAAVGVACVSCLVCVVCVVRVLVRAFVRMCLGVSCVCCKWYDERKDRERRGEGLGY